MKKLLLVLTSVFPILANSQPLSPEFLSEFDGLNIKNPENDVTLIDGELNVRMNYDDPIPDTLAKGVIFSDICVSIRMNPKLWKKYPFNRIKVTTQVEWQAYIFNGGQKECIEYWSKAGSKKYEKPPYLELWRRN